VVEPIFPAAEPARDRRPLLGYAMVAVAATLFAVNGAVSKVILESGLSTERLSEMRVTGALFGLVVALAVARPQALRVRVRELPFLAFFGICGLAFVQWLYFLAIDRIAIGVALLVQYLAPLLVALWARFVYREQVRRRIWIALALSVAGLALILQIWHARRLDTAGVAFAVGAAVTFAVYVLSAEHAVRNRDPVSLSCYGFLFAAVFWAVVRPWWSFPASTAAVTVSLHGHLAGIHLPVWALALWMIVLGTILPFGLVVGALRHISATRAGIVAMLEPVVAIAVAWLWLAQSLGAAQLLGGLVVLSAITLAQTAR
jgi:drug/metabolite transporter (DMT)-like permease